MIFNPIEPILTLLRREERGAERYPKDLPKANTSKINNCIANKKSKFFIGNNERRVRKAKERIHIRTEKLIWLIKQEDVKSNFKAL